ncbi:MAG: NUDIX hydrolase [Bacteroidales bacterium]|jgi:ADP-ribose pyrophosphatase YjhB (NUDIX family)|nr:NUDIX hydrolase [Bacteroidales bacterium]
MIQKELLNYSKRIRALAEIGLTYSENPYDRDRYEELSSIGQHMMSLLSGHPVEVIEQFFIEDREYKTPQVDIRAVVFDEADRLLLVREKIDAKWSLPGGWADIGYAPSEVAVKEVKEETGLDVLPERMIAVFDKKCHPHPPHLHYVYKLFIGCKLQGGEMQPAFDTLDVGFFDKNNIPELSEERVTRDQVQLMFDYHHHPEKPVVFD